MVLVSTAMIESLSVITRSRSKLWPASSSLAETGLCLSCCSGVLLRCAVGEGVEGGPTLIKGTERQRGRRKGASIRNDLLSVEITRASP